MLNTSILRVGIKHNKGEKDEVFVFVFDGTVQSNLQYLEQIPFPFLFHFLVLYLPIKKSVLVQCFRNTWLMDLCGMNKLWLPMDH